MTGSQHHKGQYRALGAAGLALLLSLSALPATASPPSAGTTPAAPLLAQAAPPAAPESARKPSQSRGPAASVEVRIADLRKKLRITPAEESQFNAFADVMRANALAMQELFQQRSQHRDRTAPGMLHWYTQLTSAHAEGLNKLVPVFDTLYQSLTPQQKKAADQVFQALRQARPHRKAG